MKILFIHASADLGGTEISSFQLASHLDRDEFEVGVLFHCASGPIGEDYRRVGISVWTVPFPRVGPAWRVIRRFQPDVIQIYGLKTNILWRPLLAASGHRRLIGVIQGLTNEGEKPGRWRLVWDRLTHRWLRFYVANSQTIASTLINEGFSPTKLRVIYSGLTLSGAPLRDEKQNNPPVIICVGNLRPVKGHAYLFRALQILRHRGVPFEAWVVGDGPLKEDLIAEARRRQIDPLVKFLGRVDSVEPVLRKADVFASLSLSEGMPAALMEAMSCGLPVVATRVGGVPELIRDGTEGFLVPSQATEEAAERLSMLLRDPNLRRKMGDAGRARIESAFDLKNTVREYENLYHAAAAGVPG